MRAYGYKRILQTPRLHRQLDGTRVMSANSSRIEHSSLNTVVQRYLHRTLYVFRGQACEVL